VIDHNLCKALGLDNKAVHDRIRLLELGARDKETIDKLHRFVIDPHIDSIVDEFYEFIMSHHQFRAYIQDAALVAKLTRTFRIYLTTLGVDFDTLAYFNDRLRVGIAHHRISMPLMLYECAYRKMQELLLERIPEELNDKLVVALNRVVHKIVSLDITLAIDSYHMESVRDLKGEIKNLFEKEEQIKRYASIDPLTRIRNRGAILDRLRKVCSDKTNLNDYTVIMIDIDNLREVNDQLGHLVGDYLIKLIVEKIKTVLSKKDVFGRYGGDEFMILLENKNVEEALVVAHRINKVVTKEKFLVGSDELSVSISQGLSSLGKNRKIIENIRCVDNALIKAKHKKHDKIVIAEEP
jgi:diguanylate cyclase (GGDEF)-like protein